MLAPISRISRLLIVPVFTVLVGGLLTFCPAQETAPITKGLRVFTCAHSFHGFVYPMLAEAARNAGIEGHTLPLPAALKKKPEWDDKLNRLLEELAWEAVIHHPISGVTVGK
jgi:hypothetical protein